MVNVRITQEPGQGFLDRMIALVEGAERQKTPNEIALTILLVGLTIIFLIAVGTIPGFASYAGGSVPVAILAALLSTLIPTTIAALLSAIGIAGMDRLIRFNVLAKSGRAVEAAGDVDVLLLDKTGTTTIGDRQASEFRPLTGIDAKALAEAAMLASLADETPEGRSIVTLARERFALSATLSGDAEIIPFTAQTRSSGVKVSGVTVLKGAVDSILKSLPADTPGAAEIKRATDEIAPLDMTPLAVIRDRRLLGAVALKDVVKAGVCERFAEHCVCANAQRLTGKMYGSHVEAAPMFTAVIEDQAEAAHNSLKVWGKRFGARSLRSGLCVAESSLFKRLSHQNDLTDVVLLRKGIQWAKNST